MALPPSAIAPGVAISLAELQAGMKAAPAASVFEGLAALGVVLGPRFRAIQAIWRGPGEALGRLVAPPELSELAGNLVVHPALLDACTQVVGAVSGPYGAELFVPWRYERLELYAPLPPAFYCHARLRPEAGEDRESATADLSFLDEAGRPLGQMSGVVLKRAPRALLLRGRHASADDLFYGLRWDETPLPTPAFLDDTALPRTIARINPASVLPAEPVWSRYRGLVQGLEPLALAWTVRGLQELGWQPSLADRVQAPALARRLGIAVRHERLVQRLLQLLAEAGMLGPGSDGWVVRRPLAAPDPFSVQHDLEQRFGSELPGCGHELDLLCRCGERLAAIPRG